MIYPYDPSICHCHTLGIGSSSTPVTMPSIPQIQPSSNIGSGPNDFQPSHTIGYSINGSSFVSGNGGLPFNFQDSFYSPFNSFGHQPAPTLAHDPSDNASSSSGIPAYSSSSAQQSEDQDQGYNDFVGDGLW
ncbi:hypothetical protein NCU16707 [Neurospora crassa OR74A]|uniref:Uncharacterized protein n=1 Tax=Neurospora crassa (strain ATCC 24698 / 74-OR23-1A / CBS 708.71 / DSM 1257 / FGSC 987) TaxID=367110 RepID=U9W5G7_NEUCR|nr:hypothetical protein NCU16707 [Neurospora crassa OR74A]ESA43449.1 hypothetical protein NCU16707 [Neurospora crassa OR74A]|eukprot:XP_011394071.1 hypothetical protein NCU16707 [Neurospora crassa OR74A]